MIHLPIQFKKHDITYDLIKMYENFGLYENRKSGVKECFTPHQLGTLEEEKTRIYKIKGSVFDARLL